MSQGHSVVVWNYLSLFNVYCFICICALQLKDLPTPWLRRLRRIHRRCPKMMQVRSRYSRFAEAKTLCIVLYCIVSIYLYSASCSAHQSEALPVRETQREESSVEVGPPH